MTITSKIRFLTWATLLVWGIAAASLILHAGLLFLAGMVVGSVVSTKDGIWLLIQISLLILIPIIYFFVVRRLQWNLPPEEHIIDKMDIGRL